MFNWNSMENYIANESSLITQMGSELHATSELHAFYPALLCKSKNKTRHTLGNSPKL